MNLKNLFSFLGKKSLSNTNSRNISDANFPFFYSGLGNTSGEVVTTSSALGLSAVWACVNVISQDVAKLPLQVLQRTEQGRQKQYNKVHNLLNYKPNPYISAMDFREAMQAHVLLNGNAYAEIVRNIYGEPEELYIIPPHRVQMKQIKGGYYYYEVYVDDKKFEIEYNNMLHLKGLGSDGLIGYPVVTYAAQTLGASIAVDKFAGAFYANGTTFGGFLQHPENLSTDAAKRLKDSVQASHQGVDKAHRLLLLEEGMQYKETGIAPEQAQFIETRNFNISEVCRLFRVPPHKVSDLSKATFSNIEQQSLEYVTDTLSGWFKKWEQECWSKLLSEQEQEKGFYIEHLAEGLLRGDIQTRYTAYATARQWGWLSVNDIRERENLNKIEGGDTYLQPLNMTDINTTAPASFEASAFVKDIAQRIGKTELEALDKQLKREDFDNDLFTEWREKFYSKHSAYIQKTLSPVATLSSAEAYNFTLYSGLISAEDKKGFLEQIKNTYIETLEGKINELINK